MVTEVTNPEKPSFYFKDIPPGAKCDCGKFAVTYEIIIPSKDTIFRCESCFKNLREQYKGANWKQGFSEMPNFDDKEAGAPS